MLAKSSEHYKQKPYFWALSNVAQPQISVAGLSSIYFDDRLDVDADDDELYDSRYSFGVSSSGDAKGVALEK